MPGVIDPRTLICDNPVVTALKPKHFHTHCHHCFRSKGFVATKRCTGCRFARYCSPACQKANWAAGHKWECKFLIQGHPEDLDWETLEEQMIKSLNGELNVAMCLLVFRLFLRSKHNALKDLIGKSSGRKWSDLMSHEIDIRKSREMMDYFRVICDFLVKELHQKLDINLHAELFEVFGKIVINSHSIYEWDDRGQCNQIGVALSLDISALDHSCAPTVDLFSKGKTTYAIPIVPGHDAHDTEKSFISYTNLSTPRWARKKFLREHYFFDCQCSRCTSDDDHYLTAFTCEDCRGPVPFPEDPLVKKDASRPEPKPIVCPGCNMTPTKARINEAKSAMATLRIYVGTGCAPVSEADEEYLDKQKHIASLPPLERTKLMQSLKSKTDDILPNSNAYRALLFYYLVQCDEMAPSLICLLTSAYYSTLQSAYPRLQARNFLTELFFVSATLAQNGEIEKAREVLEHMEAIVEPLLRIDQWCLVDDLLKRHRKYIIDGDKVELD